MDRNDVEILQRDTVYRGYLAIDRYKLRHRLFGGGWSPPLVREVLERGHSVAVLPYDPVADAVVLIEQFRIGALAAGREPWLVECVAGMVEGGETPEAVARREAAEEIGCALGRVETIAEFLYSPGGSSETCRLFAGEVDSRLAAGIHGLADEHEDIAARVVPAEAALARLDDGGAGNAVLLIALSWLARNRGRLRAEWAAESRP